MRVKDGVTRKWGKYVPHYYYNKLKDTQNLISQKKDDCNQRQTMTSAGETVEKLKPS